MQPGPPVYVLASAQLDEGRLIRRFTSLVWPQLTDEQERAHPSANRTPERGGASHLAERLL